MCDNLECTKAATHMIAWSSDNGCVDITSECTDHLAESVFRPNIAYPGMTRVHVTNIRP